MTINVKEVVRNSFNCLSHFKHVYGDDDDEVADFLCFERRQTDSYN